MSWGIVLSHVDKLLAIMSQYERAKYCEKHTLQLKNIDMKKTLNKYDIECGIIGPPPRPNPWDLYLAI